MKLNKLNVVSASFLFLLLLVLITPAYAFSIEDVFSWVSNIFGGTRITGYEVFAKDTTTTTTALSTCPYECCSVKDPVYQDKACEHPKSCVENKCIETTISSVEEGGKTTSTESIPTQTAASSVQSGTAQSETMKTTTSAPALICKDSCPSEGTCYPFGYRKEGKYCSDEGSFKEQLTENSACENNFECSTNVCVDGKCMSSGLIQMITDWFKKTFSFMLPNAQAEKSILTLSMPIWFAKENNFTEWAVIIDGNNITPKMSYSELGKTIETDGKYLSAGNHTLALVLYYPDGWHTKLVWSLNMPSDQKDLFDVGKFVINVPVLSSPPVKEEPPPLKVVMLTPEALPQMELHISLNKTMLNETNCTVIIKDLKGIVDVKRPEDADWVEAQINMTLPGGTEVSTGYDSEVTLGFTPVPPCDEKTVTIKSLTQVKVEPLLFKLDVVETKLKLDTGTINVEVKKGELKTDLKVATPYTTYREESEPDILERAFAWFFRTILGE